MTPKTGSVRYLLNGVFYRMAFTEWAQPAMPADAPAVVCVHGLTRNGRDFDPLAMALSRDFRVICPDLPGRGQSDWLPDGALYQPVTYCQALSHLLAAIGGPVMWVGTSLGGICGMMLAAAQNHPLSRLVLNDVGPFIPAASLARIRRYMADTPDFADLNEAEAHLRKIHAPFGKLTDRQWQHLARHSMRDDGHGRLQLHYDPAIAQTVLAGAPADVDLSALWDRIAIPVLGIRGATSDLLLPETLDRMTASGAQSLTVDDAGHAPALMDESSIAAVHRFLTG